MTETQAHEFLAKWSRRWLGHKSMNEYETIRKIKVSCFCLMMQPLIPLGVSLPKIFDPEKNHYFPIFILTFSFFVFCLSTWLLIRTWQACKTLGKKF